MLSHMFLTVLPEQFTMWVTLLATMNSKSYQYKNKRWGKWWLISHETYLCGEFITNEKSVFDFDGAHEVIFLIGTHEVFWLWNAHTSA